MRGGPLNMTKADLSRKRWGARGNRGLMNGSSAHLKQISDTLLGSIFQNLPVGKTKSLPASGSWEELDEYRWEEKGETLPT